MDNWPPIGILYMTSGRDGDVFYPRRTTKAFLEKIEYTGPFVWYVSCGGKDEEHWKKVKETISPIHYGGYKDDTPGLNWNKGIKTLYEHVDIYLRLEDDFELQQPLNLHPYVKLLYEQEDIGMVRLGLMPINLDLESIGYDGNIYLDVKKSRQYCFSGHPGLIHKRFHDAYGGFHPSNNPGDCEVEFDSRVRETPGPSIVFPWNLGAYGTYGPWAHIGDVQSY